MFGDVEMDIDLDNYSWIKSTIIQTLPVKSSSCYVRIVFICVNSIIENNQWQILRLLNLRIVYENRKGCFAIRTKIIYFYLNV